MKLVQFKNGEYGIRKGWLRYYYLSIYDAKNSRVNWQQGHPVHHFYRGSYDDVLAAYNWISDSGKVVKP
jgi:hypothetical protein